jgi:CheY-like chemotaxis protein
MTNHPRRAVIAEDNPILRELIAKALGWAGPWEIVKVAEGGEALAIIAAHGANLLIVDWKMAGVDGLECTRRIRAGENGIDRTIPVILVTAAGDELTEAMAEAVGVSRVLRKPFALTQLHQAIQQLAGG